MLKNLSNSLVIIALACIIYFLTANNNYAANSIIITLALFLIMIFVGFPWITGNFKEVEYYLGLILLCTFFFFLLERLTNMLILRYKEYAYVLFLGQYFFSGLLTFSFRSLMKYMEDTYKIPKKDFILRIISIATLLILLHSYFQQQISNSFISGISTYIVKSVKKHPEMILLLGGLLELYKEVLENIKEPKP